MKAFFKDLYEYSHKYNQEYILVLLQHKQEVSDRVLKLMCHILNAEKIWNNRIEKTGESPNVWQIHPLEELMEMDRLNHQKSLLLVETSDFEHVLEYKNSKGEKYVNKVGDIIFHVINHSNYHRAQIASDLKSAGIEPPVSDFIFYKRSV